MKRPRGLRPRLRFGRRTITYSNRALYVSQAPDPRCLDCRGEGGWWETTAPDGSPLAYPDPATCDCYAPTLRIPLWRAPRYRHLDQPF